ncbi:MAG TPA: DCC1-like thiol-disulfide oxidoreductase family protein [Xanthobacteraceae bacterium]|nr:DCC1-like thiol-disulfide oxidoreductase family protein [Xanthobacteraceae bacterium]
MEDCFGRYGQPGQKGLILYDGDCMICSGWFRFVAKRDVERRFLFTAIQSEFGRALAVKLGIDPDDPATNAVLLDGQVHLRSDSALSVLAVLPGWGWTRVLRIVPGSLRDRLYGLIARNRYRLFGTRESCDFGDAGLSDRIIR